MRLSNQYQESIKSSFLEVFKDGDIYLFGSRVDDTKKGGDIDLYILPAEKLSIGDVLNKKNKFRIILEDKIGEQKVDIIVSKDKNRTIEIEALKIGIKL